MPAGRGSRRRRSWPMGVMWAEGIGGGVWPIAYSWPAFGWVILIAAGPFGDMLARRAVTTPPPPPPPQQPKDTWPILPRHERKVTDIPPDFHILHVIATHTFGGCERDPVMGRYNNLVSTYKIKCWLVLFVFLPHLLCALYCCVHYRCILIHVVLYSESSKLRWFISNVTWKQTFQIIWKECYTAAHLLSNNTQY